MGWTVNATPRPLYPENIRYPSLCGSLGRSALTGVLTPNGPARSWWQYWLPYPAAIGHNEYKVELLQQVSDVTRTCNAYFHGPLIQATTMQSSAGVRAQECGSGVTSRYRITILALFLFHFHIYYGYGALGDVHEMNKYRIWWLSMRWTQSGRLVSVSRCFATACFKELIGYPNWWASWHKIHLEWLLSGSRNSLA